MTGRRWGLLLTLLLAAGGALPGWPAAQTVPAQIAISPVGIFVFDAAEPGDAARRPDGLSGIAYAGGNRYLAVSDRHTYLHSLTIEIDPVTGGIDSAEFGPPLRLNDSTGVPLPEASEGPDREGIIYDPESNSVWISNEHTGPDRSKPSISKYSLSDGRRTAQVLTMTGPLLSMFNHIRPNRGFEGLARRADGSEVWTSNEEALTIDGSPATTEVGTVVRLLMFDGELKPVAQFAYLTDPVSGTIRITEFFSLISLSRVSDLLALPNGTLLVMESELGGGSDGIPRSRIRIYQADFAGATDVSGNDFREGLQGKNYQPVGKTLLVELKFSLSPTSNFEGMALGPHLENGDRSLLLIADNGRGLRQALYALRLSGLPAAD